MECWKCGKTLDDPSYKLPFRATCEFCHVALHCCKNCRHYKPGLPNDCEVPETDFVADREGINFCEEFSLVGKKVEQKTSLEDVSKKLFGGEPEKQKPNPFDDLFH